MTFLWIQGLVRATLPGALIYGFMGFARFGFWHGSDWLELEGLFSL